MARRYVLVDDLDNRESTEDNPVETLAFSYRGASYTIDLSAKNAAAFDKLMSKYADAATEVVPERPAPARRARRSASGSAGAGKSETAEIRAWAVARGLMAEGSRGRIPLQIVTQYRQDSDSDGKTPEPASASA